MEDYSYWVIAGSSAVKEYLDGRYAACVKTIKAGDGMFCTFNPCEDSFEAFVENITGWLEVAIIADEHKPYFINLI